MLPFLKWHTHGDDPICSICFPCYRAIKDRSNKHVHMFPCSHETLCCHVSHCSGTGGYPYRSQMLPIMCVCVNNNTKQHKKSHKITQNNTKPHKTTPKTIQNNTMPPSAGCPVSLLCKLFQRATRDFSVTQSTKNYLCGAQMRPSGGPWIGIIIAKPFI